MKEASGKDLFPGFIIDGDRPTGNGLPRGIYECIPQGLQEHIKTYEQRGHENDKADIYNYDALYRLKDITFNADDPTSPTTFEKKKELQFDKVDNILKIVEQTPTSTHELINTLTGVNAQLNQYTQFDQWGLTHDLNGNTSQKGTQFFTYDYRNQLIKTTDQGTEVSFKYDVLGRRIEKSIGSNLTNYFYAGNQVIEERDGSDTVMKQFIYGNGIDEVLRMDKYESGTPTPYYYHTNSIGSITAITDNTGNLVERIDYDIYGMPTFTDYITDPGNPTIVENSVIGNEYLFHGRRYDNETNLYYYRARYYDPIMGRFLQTDPMGYKDSMNLYQAFNMNPVNYTDPLGEFFVVPYNDINRERILMALAIGSLTPTGSPTFWKLFNDSRPVIIESDNLPAIRNRRTGNIRVTFGEIKHNNLMIERGKVIGLRVSIDFNNIVNYSQNTQSMPIGQGRVDPFGITTIYHELDHVTAYFKSAPWTNIYWSISHGMAARQDLPSSSTGSAQRFGENVYQQFTRIQNLDPLDILRIITLIEARMAQYLLGTLNIVFSVLQRSISYE